MRWMVLLGLLLVAPMGWAQTGGAQSFTPAQRAEIIALVRQALKDDPSLINDAITSAKNAALFAHAGDPVAGNPQGDVTLVEFYDPRCPYCRKMLPDMAAIMAADPKLRVVYKDIPVLGPASELETRAILAAERQGAYSKMQHALMTNAAPPNELLIRQVAGSLGLDTERLLKDMNSDAVTQQIDQNLALAKDLKVEGTPVFMVGDNVIPGAVDAAQLQAAIAQARHGG